MSHGSDTSIYNIYMYNTPYVATKFLRSVIYTSRIFKKRYNFFGTEGVVS